jgi:very-short-patch-repair endonuclease
MRGQGRTAARELARIAEAQYGVVTRRQALDAGLTATEVDRRVETGALLREYRGVYRVGHRAPSVEACYLAAVLACGNGALLSGAAAAYLLGLTKGPAPSPEVITMTERRIPGIRTQRSRRRDSRDATRWRWIPVTSPQRTLVDLAGVLTEDTLARACHEAGIRHGTTPDHVEEVLAHRPGSAGAARLRKVLHGDVAVTLSALERRFLDRLRQVGLPTPRTNVPAGGQLVDCRWPEHRLTVELDGYRYHRSRHAWEADRRREREARSRGDEVRRYTYDDVFAAPAFMVAELRALLRPSRPA